jgi:thioredoxin reductase
VSRQRGIATGAVLGAALLVLGTLAAQGRSALQPRGLPALPHAALECSACHVALEPARPRALVPNAGGVAAISTACSGCHGEHPSRRAQHRALAARGELECGACHAVHRAEDGVRFAAGVPVVHYGAGFERVLRGVAPEGLVSPRFIPLVARERCAACHEPGDASDPASSCFAAANPDYNLCFDEHRPPADATSGQGRGRDVAREAARRIVLAGDARAASADVARSALVFVASLASAFLIAFVVRSRRPAVSRGGAVKSPLASPSKRRLPQIDTLRCLGCHACVDACPYDVLEVERYVARVARPNDCCGLVTCERACPNGSLVVHEGPASPETGPSVTETLELTTRPGSYVAGDASGSSLIRNAVRQGAAVARHVQDALRERGTPSKTACDVDLAIVGAGPAGLSAGLEALRLGLSVIVIEQATVAESIRRFSRGKLVLDADAESEESLPLFVGETHKEELLARWMRRVRQADLRVRENQRVTAVQGEKDAFCVRMQGGQALTARRVLVAVGRRGTPRKLDCAVPQITEARVHYELSDAQAFAGQRVVVVGLGDVAMEAALALAAQPGTQVSVLYRGHGFQRGKRRNVDALSALVTRGRVRLEFGSEIVAVGVRLLDVRVRDTRRSLEYDALFVLIGSLPGGELLK